MNKPELYKAYVEWIGQGAATRKDAAEHFGVHKSTAQYHLETAVTHGELVKVADWTDHNQVGWVYQAPQRELMLPFEFDADEYEQMYYQGYDQQEIDLQRARDERVELSTPRL